MKNNELTKLNAITDPENLSQEYQMESLSKAEEEIKDLHEKLAMTAKMSLALAFELGKRLTAVKESLNHGEFIPWLEQNMSFSRSTAFRYMKLYEQQKCFTVKHLENTTLQEAYIEAGLKKAATAPPPVYKDELLNTLEPLQKGEIKTAGEKKHHVEVMGEKLTDAFKRKTKSGVELEHHRVECVADKRVYIYRRDVFNVFPALDSLLLFADWPEPDKREVIQSLEVAMELYCAKVEELEERGAIKPPKDMGFLKVWEEMQKKKGKTRRRSA